MVLAMAVAMAVATASPSVAMAGRFVGRAGTLKKNCAARKKKLQKMFALRAKGS